MATRRSSHSSPSQRRNTLSALFLLAGLAWAVIFLCLGLTPKALGFLEAGKPASAFPPETEPPQRQISETAVQSVRSPSLSTLSRALDTAGRVASKAAASAGESFDHMVDNASPALNDLLDRDHAFIELYGGAQRLMLRQVVEDPEPKYTVVRLTDTMLTFANLQPQQTDMTVRAQEMGMFARRVQRRFGTPLLYVQAPSKLDVAQLPNGVVSYADAEADQFLSLLEADGVDTLDLRPTFRAAAEKDPEQAQTYFFNTDHHWTPAGGFLGYQTLCEKLMEDYDVEIDEELMRESSFDKYTLKDVFLGSQGKRVGTLYAGLDDLEIWSPSFSTDFTYLVPLNGIQREGPFAVSLLLPERLLEDDLYESNPYAVYTGGDYLLTRAINRNNPDGIRILVLRDSYGCVLTPFLSLAAKEVMAMDCRSFNGGQSEMMKQIQWLEPDLIIVLSTTSSLEVDELYPYLPTARANALAAKEASEE